MGFRSQPVLLAVLLLMPVVACPSNSQNRPPHSIILISVDTLRADHLSCYGYERAATPHIDAMAEGGALFTQVDSQVPLTLPSHVSLLTSTYPFSNGVRDNGQELPADAVTLASVLRSRGYATAAFVGGFVLDRRFGLGQGFDFYDSPFDLHRHAGKDPGDIKRPGQDVVSAAERWLADNSRRPFFAFVHFYDLHTPYELPAAERARFDGLTYDAELSYVDDVLGRFWGFLRERGLLQDTLVVFTSDHGESLGEHGESTHGYFIYQSTLRVPLIFHWPDGSRLLPARINQPVSLLDVAPTILQLLAMSQPPEFQGQGLLGMLPEKVPSAPAEIYSESLYAHNHFGASSLGSLRVGQYQYIEAPRPELYDLNRDPEERHNLYGVRKAVALTLRERLLSLRSRFGSHGIHTSRALTPEVIERLSSLGYAASGGGHSVPPDSGPDPKDRIADFELYGRALTLASAGDFASANRILEQLLGKDSGLVDVRLSLGLNQQRVGQHAEAAENFREVLKKDPLNVLAHFDLGVSDFELQKLDDAVKEVQATLAIAPYYTRAGDLLGTIWLQKKDYERGRDQFNRVLTVDPSDYSAHYNLGALATLEGRWDEGERHLKAALETDSFSAEAHNTLGSLYLRRGDLTSAQRELEQALRLQPKFAWAHYNLGLVFRGQKNDADAAREFREAVAVDPRFQPARDALDRLPTLP